MSGQGVHLKQEGAAFREIVEFGELRGYIAGIKNEATTVVAPHPREFMDALVCYPDFEIEGKTMRRETAHIGRFLGVVVHGFAKIRLWR